MPTKRMELMRSMEYAEAVAIEARERLLENQVDPLLIANAMAYEGLFRLVINHLEPAQQLMACEDLETFVRDTRRLLDEHAHQQSST